MSNESTARTAEGREATESGPDGLIPRIRLAEGRPLAERATAFAAIHDELRTRLEGGGTAGA